jgi:hypothetical protein
VIEQIDAHRKLCKEKGLVFSSDFLNEAKVPPAPRPPPPLDTPD